MNVNQKNIAYNYASQVYGTVIWIMAVPIYIKQMGAEAYGLIGFFAMLQAWFLMLDVGLTPTMTREATRFQGGAIDGEFFRRLLRILECLLLGISILGATGIISFSNSISIHWLKIQQLQQTEVKHAIIFMAFIVSLRLISGLYRSVIYGFDNIPWLGAFNILKGSIRFGLIFPLFYLVSKTPTVFLHFN